VAPESAQKSRSPSVSTICIRERNRRRPSRLHQLYRCTASATGHPGTLQCRGIEPSARYSAGSGARSGPDRTDQIDAEGRGNESVPSLPLADHDPNPELASEDRRKGVMPFGPQRVGGRRGHADAEARWSRSRLRTRGARWRGTEKHVVEEDRSHERRVGRPASPAATALTKVEHGWLSVISIANLLTSAGR